MRGRKLLYNTLLLTGASMFMRAVTVSFQVYLAGVIGPAGVGLFSLIASAQFFALTFATSGIRFATTRLVSEEIGQNRHANVPLVMRRAFCHALFFGTLAALFLFTAAPLIGRVWIDDLRTILPLRILAISLPCIAIIASLNGYFVAVSRVVKSASMSVFEYMLRIGVVVFLFTFHTPGDLESALVTVVIGGVLSEVLSCLILLTLYLHDKRHIPNGKRSSVHLSRRLLGISLPLAFSTYARSALNTLQHMLIPRGLRESGITGDDALANYGLVHGMALPIVLFPSAVFYSVSELMIPELTAAQVANDTRRIRHLVSQLLRFSLYGAIGLSGLFLVFALPLGDLIYPNTAGVGVYIRILAFLMPIMFLDAITDGMLKGLGQQVYSMGVNIIDSLLSVVLVYLLLPIFGIRGFLFMVFFTEAFNFLLSLRRILQMTRVDLGLSHILRPILSILFATQVAMLLARTIGIALTASLFSVTVHLLLSALLYTFTLCLLGCFSRADLQKFRRLLT